MNRVIQFLRAILTLVPSITFLPDFLLAATYLAA
jgi:hypothetical protein